MREIKFQVVENGKVVATEFSDPQFNDGCWCHCLASDGDDPVIRYGGYVPKGLPRQIIRRQFTRLLDKNGKEIYEGDIIRDIDSKACGKVVYILSSGVKYTGGWRRRWRSSIILLCQKARHSNGEVG